MTQKRLLFEVFVINLLILTLFYIGISTFSDAGILNTIEKTYGWFFIIIGVSLLISFISVFFIFPSAVLSIRPPDDNKGPFTLNNYIQVIVDGYNIKLDPKLPQQVKLCFMRKGEYQLYIKISFTEHEKKMYEEKINLFEFDTAHKEVVLNRNG